MYKLFIRPLLFLLHPETVHNIVFKLMRAGAAIPGVLVVVRLFFAKKSTRLQRTVFGIRFPNPVGIAAGLDKDAEAFDMLGAMGFGFVEIGTVTPVAQPGNPQPRLFRAVKDKALINRMGFNNKGVMHCIKQLKKRRTNIIIGGNIGKNKITPNQSAIDDYIHCYEELYDYVDYFVINISSPNTPGLRELQDKEPLMQLAAQLVERNRKQTKQKPILLKIAPDLLPEQLDDIIEIVQNTGLDGIVATNTTISRNRLSIAEKDVQQIGDGGMSGKPLTDRSTEVIRYIAMKSKKAFPIIGVGGIMSPQDAIDKLEAGADLVQVYTGFIYNGPATARQINKAILKM